jgi:hypothetical protein
MITSEQPGKQHDQSAKQLQDAFKASTDGAGSNMDDIPGIIHNIAKH